VTTVDGAPATPLLNLRSAPPISDGNSPWNEGFAFSSVEAYAAFRKLHTELFDREASPRDLAERWKAFGQTSVGRGLRWR
jgi:hypothetical protein